MNLHWEGRTGIEAAKRFSGDLLIWLIIGVIVLGIGYMAATTSADDQNQWDHGDCSEFATYRIDSMPARCVKEYTK